MARKRRLNIFLFKQTVLEFEDALKEPQDLTRLPLQDDIPFPGAVFLKGSFSKKPKWLSFVEDGLTLPVDNLFTSSSSALIILKTKGRLFCLVFGYARHWIDETKIERRFGLIATLNSVNPDSIRSIDARQIDTITRSTKTQTSRITSLDNFGLDIRRDLMRAVTGVPKDPTFATRVSGSDQLVLNVAIEFCDLAKKCDDALERYEELTYQEDYPWIDNLSGIKDPSLISELDKLLLSAIHDRDVEKLYLAPPEEINFDELDGFTYRGINGDAGLRFDIDIIAFLETFPDVSTITLDDLKKKHKIETYIMGVDTPVYTFSVYNSVVFEKEKDDKLYVLSYGEWFQINNRYVNEVENELSNIQYDEELDLPQAGSNETEPDYNLRAQEASNGNLALMDGKFVQYGGGYSKVEVCDLLSLERHFIHVKRKTRSATLSHLFAQGLNSALFFRDREFRQLALEICPASHKDLINIPNPDPAGYTIVYAVITASQKSLKEALPFFSKQSLENAARELTRNRYNVRIRKIKESQ